jgi:hypothetical protein
MAEKVIRNNQSLVPFFGERLSFIRGLDPLGLQNTSDATYSMLLPGLNNVTGRIRYYSFYCWLLDEYSKQNGSTNPDDQKKFIRRAEYIIALASSYYEGDASSIPGSLYASKQISKNPETVHNLQKGTFNPDGTTKDTYWQYPLGAFGQYYYGSLNDIGLVSKRDNETGLYVRSNSRGNGFVSGEELSKAFATNLSENIKITFFDCLQAGEITEAQLSSLLPNFNLTKVPPESTEQEMLLCLLVQKDYPVRIEEEPKTHRKTTIQYLLQFAKKAPEQFNDRSFIYECYNEKGSVNGQKEATIMGWYYYQFNEYWHYANTAILNGTLGYLETKAGPNWQALKPFLDEATQKITDEFISLKLVSSGQDSLKTLLSALSANEQEFLTACGEKKSITRTAYGFLLMYSQYLNQYKNLILLKEYSEINDLGKDGEGSHYYIHEFSAKTDLNIKQFLFEYLYRHIIYRHQYVAFRKMRGGTQSTQKFIIEDHHIRYLGNFEAGFTGPRIGNLINYLKDLDTITADNKLTESGKALLNEITYVNN